MIISTIGFTQKSAEQFFNIIKNNGIEILLDIRLNNRSQLAGFTKGDDLCYFLSEICNCKYKHCLEYAPTKELLDDYKNNRINWNEYVERYIVLINNRGSVANFETSFSNYKNVCLLCSEPTSEKCHRRLLAEMIVAGSTENLIIKHL